MKHDEKHLPDWADDWVPRKKCPVCKARLVVCNTWGTAVAVCSESGWALEPDVDCHPLPSPPVAPSVTTNCANCLMCHAENDAKLDESQWIAKLCHGMVVCPTCGNKRCPKATSHRLDCTNSNEPGQLGSAYFDDVPSPAPSVGELEWEPVNPETRDEFTAGFWTISDHDDHWHLFFEDSYTKLNDGHDSFEHCAALANSLQRILSGELE